MAKHRCNFGELERKILLRLYEIVKDMEQKMDYVIEKREPYYYPERQEESYDGKQTF